MILAKGVDADALPKSGRLQAARHRQPPLDTFGRTRRILWKDGRFAQGTVTGEPNAPPLVELAYAFDRASNLVAKADARRGSSRKRDEQYTLDGLMRLLKARRGDFTGADPAPGAFVAAPGTQKYQYDFVGNIRSTDILANASEQQSAADRKLAASFNAVNEQTNCTDAVGESTERPTHHRPRRLRQAASKGFR